MNESLKTQIVEAHKKAFFGAEPAYDLDIMERDQLECDLIGLEHQIDMNETLAKLLGEKNA